MSGILVARAIQGDALDFAVTEPTEPVLATVLAGLALGTLLGALGAAYNNTLIGFIDRIAAVTAVPKLVKGVLVGGVVGLVAWFEPMLVGGGDPLIQVPLGAPVAISVLLVVGAVFGALFAQVAAMLMPGPPILPTIGAIVGMAAFFTAVVRAPFTGVLGMTGSMTPLLPILAARVAAIIVPYVLGNAPISDTLRARMPHSSAPPDPVPWSSVTPAAHSNA